MSILRKAIIKASGNRFMQRLLEKNVEAAQYLMGIGSGGSVLSSGERAIFHLLEQRSSPPYCVFDVGSNKGQFLQLALASIPGEVTIHCFEPGRETFRMLAESFRGEERAILNNVALGKEQGDAILHYDSAGSGLASLTKRKLDHFMIEFGASERVEINTIDDYCRQASIDYIHLLKIDVEGHELDVLAGGRRMFAARLIDIVTFEFGGCNIDSRTFFQDYWYFFRSIGYRISRITPSGYLCPIASYREIDEQFRTVNFIAVPD